MGVVRHGVYGSPVRTPPTGGCSAYLFTRAGRFGTEDLFDVTFPSVPGANVHLVFGSEVSWVGGGAAAKHPCPTHPSTPRPSWCVGKLQQEGIRNIPEAARNALPKVFLPMDDRVIRSYNLANAASVGTALWAGS